MNTTVTKEEFDEFENQIKELAAKLHGESDDMMPHLFVMARNMEGEKKLVIVALATDFNDTDDKKRALSTVGKKFYEEQLLPVAVFMNCEAWVASMKKEEYEKNPVMPRDHPDKKEVALLAGAEIGCKHFSLSWAPISRDENNKPTVGSWQSQDPDKMHMPILGYFYQGFFEEIAKKHEARDND
jgi:hypothetical protein